LTVDLHTENQSILTQTIANWKRKAPEFKKQELVFLLGRF